MIPFFRGAGAPGGTTDNQISVATPTSVTAGDVIIAVVAASSATVTVTTPAGWTQIRTITGTGYRNVILRRTATSSEPSFYTFPLSATVTVVAIAVAYGNVDTAAPVDVDGSTTATSTTATAPSITTSGAQRMIVALTGSVANTTVSTPAGTTSRTTIAGTPTVRLSDYIQSTAGATGAKTSTIGVSSANIGYQLALKPANLPPNAPSLTSPVGGVSVDRTASKTFTWTISDPDAGDSQSAYDLQYRLVGATSWTTVSAATSTAARTFPGYTFPAGNYEWQVRTYDSHGEVGAWSSSGLFTATTPPPNAPTLTAPPIGAVIDRTNGQRFSWAFSDGVIGESQSQFDLQYRIVGAGSWTTITTATPNQFLDVGGGTLVAGNYEWQVRTYDSHGQVGPWSSSSFFTAADPPAGPVITSPVSDQLITHSPATVTWSAPDQATYQLRRVADAGGTANTSTVYFDTGEVTDVTRRSLDVAFPVDARTEHIQLRVRDSHAFLSPWTDVRVSTSYTLPPTPIVALLEDSSIGAITVDVNNPPPAAGGVGTAANDIYRRVAGAPDSVRVAAALPTNTSWTDRTPASGVDYEYLAVAIGTNGLDATSAWAGVAADPAHYPAVDLYPSLSTFPGE